MSGKLKRKYDNENINFNKSLKKPLNELEGIIVWNIELEDFLKMFKKYYPYEWQNIVSRQEYYKIKQNKLNKRKNNSKNRYNTDSPENYFKSIPKVMACVDKFRKKPKKEKIDFSLYEKDFYEFEQTRLKKIEKRKNKLEEANKDLQHIDPLYVDIYIGFYERKSNINNVDLKREILEDLIKYDGVKINNFLYKINDTEINYELQKMAFYELQKRGKYVKLMKKGKKGKINKSKLETVNHKSNLEWTPKMLFNKLNIEKQQQIKQYDYFISHSYKDNDLVRNLIKKLNNDSKTCYCDWMSDNDFLRRELVSEYTKEVLKYRIEQSDELIYFKTKNSMESQWVRFELEYARELDKEIIIVEKQEEIFCIVEK